MIGSLLSVALFALVVAMVLYLLIGLSLWLLQRAGVRWAKGKAVEWMTRYQPGSGS